MAVRGKTDNGKSDSSIRGQPENLHNPLCYLFPFLKKRHTTVPSKQHAINYSQDSQDPTQVHVLHISSHFALITFIHVNHCVSIPGR